MKNVITILVAFLMTINVFSQAPQKMSYQAVIRNISNTLVTSSPIGMRISIIQGSALGTSVYVETQTLATNTNGLATLEIGSGTVITGTFSNINWAAGPYFIKTETDPNGGANYSISGTTELLSVPYSLFSAASTNGFTHYIGELYQGGIIVFVWKVSGIEHGLIASLTDVSVSSNYSNVSSQIGLSAESFRDGQTNTTSILNQSGHVSSAALLCDSYSSSGYNNWYLPSIWELSQCNIAAYIINEILGDVNGFQAGFNIGYISSTETTNNGIWMQNFHYSSSGNGAKNTFGRVRAVRKF